MLCEKGYFQPTKCRQDLFTEQGKLFWGKKKKKRTEKRQPIKIECSESALEN